jgi:hypothetical protein
VPVIDIEICRSGKKDFCLDIGCVPEHLQAAFMVSPFYTEQCVVCFVFFNGHASISSRDSVVQWNVRCLGVQLTDGKIAETKGKKNC